MQLRSSCEKNMEVTRLPSCSEGTVGNMLQVGPKDLQRRGQVEGGGLRRGWGGGGEEWNSRTLVTGQ